MRPQAHSIFQRSHYTFGGAKGQANQYWQQVPAWEDIKNYASNTEVLPEPTLWQQIKSFVTRKPVREIQVGPALCSVAGPMNGACHGMIRRHGWNHCAIVWAHDWPRSLVPVLCDLVCRLGKR